MADAPDQRPAPSAMGTLAERPLLHLLVYARNRRLTGELEIHADGGRSGVIHLWRGRITGARTTPPVAYFGTVAYELGHIDTPTLDATLLEIARSKRLHGEVLVERGALSKALRDEVLAEQACRKVHELFSLPPEASFAFYDSRPATEEPPLTLDPIAPGWRGLRDYPLKDNVEQVLARFATATLGLVNEGPTGRAGFTADESAVCTALAARPMTIAQLRVASRLPSARVDLILYLLIIAKCVEPGAATSQAMPAAAKRSTGSIPAAAARSPSGSMAATAVAPGHPPAPTSRPNMRAMSTSVLTPGAPIATGSGEVRRSLSFRVPSRPAMRAAAGSSPPPLTEIAEVFGPADVGAGGIAHRSQSIDSEDYFQALGLAEAASVEAVRAAYFRLAKLWHPDRLPADLAPFSVEVATIFDHMTRAHAVLTDADARREYLVTREKKPDPSKAAVSERPQNEVVRTIEQALAKRDYLTAEMTGQQLIALNPDDAEAHALIAWASTFAGEGPEETLRAAMPLLDKAIHLDMYCARAYFYRGVMNKRLGSAPAAFKDFARVVQLNPKHVDAQREIRIMEMRARKGGSGEHVLDALIAKVKKK